MTNLQKERVVFIDYLRVFATFAVVVLHVSAQNWYVTDVNGFEWQTFNIYDSLVRWGVPVFLMISGALFLDRDISLEEMYKKYLLRMVIAFCYWSIVYMLLDRGGTIGNRIEAAILGHYHMWFIRKRKITRLG